MKPIVRIEVTVTISKDVKTTVTMVSPKKVKWSKEEVKFSKISKDE